MIFSRLFAASYTSSKPEKRLEAINNLSPEKPAEKTILHELAFNDDSADVSLAALEKLNTFVLWQKMAHIAKNDRVKRLAEKRVESALLQSSDIVLSDSERDAYLRENANAELIQHVVSSNTSIIDNTLLAKALLRKVDKPSFTQFVLVNTSSDELKAHIVSSIKDATLLQKLAKKVTSVDVNALLNARIEELRVDAQKPKALSRALTLCLSKYQALKDKQDVDVIESNKAALEAEYTSLFQDIALLDDEHAKSIAVKYEKIHTQLTRYLAQIKPQWEAAKHERAIASLVDLYQQQMTHANQQVNWLFEARLCEATLADVAVVNESVRGVEATIDQLARMSYHSVDSAKAKVAALNETLDAFSMQQQYAQKLLSCVERAEALTRDSVSNDGAGPMEPASDVNSNVLEEVVSLFEALQDKYNNIAAQLIKPPSSIDARFKKVRRDIRAKQREVTSRSKNEMNSVRKQLSVIDSLVSQGKFRAAMAKFNRVKASFSRLSVEQQSQLQIRFDNTASEIERLEGWQQYLAAPRKPLLVEQAQQLAESEAGDIKERSEAIRVLRQQWLSLTGADDSDDKALQEAFDEALEKAFQPCRQHYAELDAQRAEALAIRKALVEEATALDPSLPEDVLSKHVDRLSKKWSMTGQVEKAQYEILKKSWHNALAPHQESVKAWRLSNAEKKSALVDEALALCEAQDLSQAADAAQVLQKQWKAIGHAGKRSESKLWSAFKSANDTLFTKLKESRKAQDQASQAQTDALLQTLMSIAATEDATEKMEQLSDFERDLPALAKPQLQKVERQIGVIRKQLNDSQQQVKKRRLQERATALLSVLEHGEIPQVDTEHGEKIGKRLLALLTANHPYPRDRAWLTVALEVVTENQTPDNLSEVRTNVQLTLMTNKLEHGENMSARDVVNAWLSHGVVKSEELDFLARFATIIEANPKVLD